MIYTTKSESLAAVADAIRDKTGKSAKMAFPDEFVSEIEGIETGGGSGGAIEEKDVNFFDYDGTLLYSYTVKEAAALAALPDGPTHDGLAFQGWNWTLDAIQAMGRAVDVGATFITDDGKTRLYIQLESLARPTISITFTASVDGGVTIDWGDGGDAETSSGTTSATYTHTYTATGEYMITLEATDGTIAFDGFNGDAAEVKAALRAVEIGVNVISIGASAFLRCCCLQTITIPDSVTSIETYALRCCYVLQAIVFPDGIAEIPGNLFSQNYSMIHVSIPDSVTSIGDSVFYYCGALQSLTIPDGVTSIGDSVFYGCGALQSLTIPDGVTSIGSSTLYNCHSLQDLKIPDSVISIGSSALYGCYSLQDLKIPDGVIKINASAFQYCQSLQSLTVPDGIADIYAKTFSNCISMAEYHFLSTTPPALAATSAFSNIPSKCIIYVPQGCLEAYQAATNWVTYADYMQEEPET